MEDLIKLYKKLVSKLPESAKTKIDNSDKERGKGGIYTKRNTRYGRVIIPFDSYSNVWCYDKDIVNEVYKEGFRVLCSPMEYTTNINKLNDVPTIVRFLTFEDRKKYPIVEWENVRSDRDSYSDSEVMFVFDGKDFDNTKKNNYIGPKLIGRHEMDYADKDEILNVKMVLLYQMICCYDFESIMSDNEYIGEFIEYRNYFEKTTLYYDNPKLQEYVTKYGFTVCPIMSLFNLELAKISFDDIINGTLSGDTGRESFNRTTTKVNLHHVEHLVSGKLNHNHKNVFLGTCEGNMIDAAMLMRGRTVYELLKS